MRLPMRCSGAWTGRSGDGRKSPAAGCTKLKGYKDQWRVRVGDWRVLYIIDDAAKLVTITRIAHRREVYD